MAKYDKDTKFYWLQLKEDFFENDAIEWLEEQEPNGRDYAYFYLKLCLKSLKSNGILIRNVGNILIPYDNRKLAELTKMDFDTVCVAMKLLQEIGLIQILENGEIYITQLENLIGSKSLGALKKQQQRMINGQKVDTCPPKIEIKKEIELEKELDIKKEIYKENIFEYIEKNFGRTLSPIEYEEISTWQDNDLTRYAIKQAVLNGAYSIKYITKILYNYEKQGIKTVQQAQEKEKQFKNKKQIEPEWFDKDLKNEEMTEKEKEELDNLLENIEDSIGELNEKK